MFRTHCQASEVKKKHTNFSFALMSTQTAEHSGLVGKVLDWGLKGWLFETHLSQRSQIVDHCIQKVKLQTLSPLKK